MSLVLTYQLSCVCIAKIIIKLVSLWRLAELEASTRDIIASSSLGVLTKLKRFSNRFPETETWQWLTTVKWSPKWNYCTCICSKATNANNISPGPCCGCQSECINDDGRTLPTLFFSSPMVTLCSIGFRSVESNNGWYTSQQAQIYICTQWSDDDWLDGRLGVSRHLISFLFFSFFLAGPGERDPINKASSISIRHTPILFSSCLPSFRRLPTMFQVLAGSFSPLSFSIQSNDVVYTKLVLSSLPLVVQRDYTGFKLIIVSFLSSAISFPVDTSLWEGSGAGKEGNVY